MSVVYLVKTIIDSSIDDGAESRFVLIGSRRQAGEQTNKQTGGLENNNGGRRIIIAAPLSASQLIGFAPSTFGRPLPGRRRKSGKLTCWPAA